MKFRYYVFLFIILLPFTLCAKPTYRVPKVHEPPIVDGVINDNEWSDAVVLEDFYQISPGDNCAPSEITTAFLAYDDEYIYCAIKCFMEDPDKIRLFHCVRDKIYYTDRIFLYVDTFFSNAKAYYFGSNAYGEQAEGIVLDYTDTTIDIHYDSFGSLSDHGYEIEMRIPLKNIKYKSGKNVRWGFFLKRMIEERSEQISATPVDRNSSNYYDNYGILIFDELPANSSLKLIPSFIASYSYDENKKTGSHHITRKYDPELNIFYEPNSSVSATMTINPDFSTIEADALEIDVNERFPIYYSEKRPFFIESNDPFDPAITIYHTRNIINPIAGAKFCGILNKSSLFGLTAVDENADGSRFIDGYDGKGDALFGFTSFQNKSENGNNFIRGACALRKFKEYYNLVGNLDGRFTLSKSLRGMYQFIGSFDQDTEKKWFKGYGYFGELWFDNEYLYSNLGLKAISRSFKADLGYIPENDLQYIFHHTEWYVPAKTDKQYVRWLEFGYDANIKYDLDFSFIKEHFLKFYTGGIFKSKFEIWTGINFEMINFAGKDNHVYTPWISFETYPSDLFLLNTDFEFGKYMWFDEDDPRIEQYRKYDASLNIRPTNTIVMDVNYEYEELHNIFNAQAYELTLKYQFSKQFWIRGILQYSKCDVIDNDMTIIYTELNIYPLFVYNPYANIAVYAGITSNDDQTKYESNDCGPVHAQWKKKDTYFLKVSYTFDVF